MPKPSVTIPAGMVELPLPDGFSGQIFAPNPDGWLSAKAVSRWIAKGVPPELEEAHWVFQEAYARSHMLVFDGLRDGSGELIVLSDSVLKEMEYPAVLAEIIVGATEELISKARNKKK